VAEDLRAAPFSVERGALRVAAERTGNGPPIVLLHGLTATRHIVVHGSKVLPRRGFRLVAYDARGHGESDPAPADLGYGYAELRGDLDAVIATAAEGERVLLAGHSMGAHTGVSYALEHAERLAGLVLIGPTYMGLLDDDVLAGWDRLADALERGGVEGFIDAVVRDVDPSWTERVRVFTRRRMLQHRHLDAIVRALREIPRSRPFEAMSELEFLDLPTLVVASHDVGDPSHPYAVASAYMDSLPAARLVSESAGEAPLAWQGGKLSREIAAFCAEAAVAERIATPAPG
jgi:pimeloyl-ACP methyl ester carboxylesterase